MKNLKVSVIGIFAVIIAFVASSFTVNHSTKKLTDPIWFTYDGSGPVDDPSSYSQATETPTCQSTAVLCAIKATDDNGRPDNTELQAMYNNGDLDEPGTSGATVKFAPHP